MTNVISGSFSEFNPEEVIERIEVHLKRIQIMKEDAKDEWFKTKREEGKKIGFWFLKKNVPWTEEELEEFWLKGSGEWYFDSPKYEVWDTWNSTINRFQRILDFCQLATAAGNRTVHLSKEDALFAYNWS